MPGGRPTDYNSEIAKIICERVATHTCGLARLCDMYDDLPDKTTINLWRSKHEEFSIQYAQSKLKQADLLAEECLDISDDARGDIKLDKDGNETINAEFVARSRLRVDTRKWLASKLLPKQYGNQKQIDELEAQKDVMREEIKELRAELDAKNKKDY